jgi:hypothetical protein
VGAIVLLEQIDLNPELEINIVQIYTKMPIQ